MLVVQLLSEGWVIHWSLFGLQTKLQTAPQEPAKTISPLKILIKTEKDFFYSPHLS